MIVQFSGGCAIAALLDMLEAEWKCLVQFVSTKSAIIIVKIIHIY